jgi:hypothetical protein
VKQQSIVKLNADRAVICCDFGIAEREFRETAPYEKCLDD